MKKLTLVLLAVVSMALVSCGGGGNKDVNTVKRLTYSVFEFFNNYQQDSIMILMPDIDYDYCDFRNDSIKITSVKLNENNQHYDVQLVKHYSENSTPEFNVQKSLSLEFAKAEDNPFGFVVVNSKGFTVADMLPSQLLYSGAIKENRKYSDKEYKEMLKVADALLQEAANKAADVINSSVQIYLKYFEGEKTRQFNSPSLKVYKPGQWREAIDNPRLFSYEDAALTQKKNDHSGTYMAIANITGERGEFPMKLVNKSNYDINGGVITYTMAEYASSDWESKEWNSQCGGYTKYNPYEVESWNKCVELHKPVSYKMSGKYDKLPANSTEEYRMFIAPPYQTIPMHKKGYSFSHLAWIERISFSITPEDVIKNTPMKQLFDGTEYDEYMKAQRANN